MCLNTPDGYLLNFDVYRGKRPECNSQYEEKIGKAAAPLVGMLENFSDSIKSQPFFLYVDNSFLGMNLIKELQERDYGASGTIDENGILIQFHLTALCLFPKKWKRGCIEIYSCLEENVAIVRWVDNAVVTVASNCHGLNLIVNVRRFTIADKKEIQTPRPNLIGEFHGWYRSNG